MELWQYYRILRKRKWLIIIGTLICVGAAAAYLFAMPKTYSASTTVMERLPDSSSVNIFSSPMLQIDPRIRLANLMELATSNSVKDSAFRKVMELNSQFGSDTVRSIIDSLDVEPVQDTTVLSLTVEAKSPTEAVDAANFVGQALIDKYNELNYGGASRARQFIADQLPAAKGKLLKIREELRKYKEGTNSVMLPNQTQALIQQLSQFENNVSVYQVQANEADAKVKSLKSELTGFPEKRTTAVTLQSNPVWQQMQVDLAKQQMDLQKMLQDRTPQHPDVLALQQQILVTERKLKEVGTTILGAKTDSTNPVRDALVQNYVSALAEASSAKAATNAAKKVLSDLKPQLLSLPAKESKLASLTAEEDAAKNTYALLKQKYDEARIKELESTSVSMLQVVDGATLAKSDTMKKILKVLLALVFGLAFSCGMAFLLNYLDNAVKTPVEAERLLGAPVFACVPLSREPLLSSGKSLPQVGAPYQMLSANLWIAGRDSDQRTILVASAEPNVGRSVTAANLAISLALDGGSVILVDADFRQPSINKLFNADNEKGLSNVLAGKLSAGNALKDTKVPGLKLITSGPQPANPVRLLRSAEMQQVVDELGKMADFVVFDSPAGVTFADATLLAAVVKNVILVHAAGSVPRGAEAEFQTRLDQVNSNIVGVVLNMVSPQDSHGYYHFRSSYGELMQSGKQNLFLPDKIEE